MSNKTTETEWDDSFFTTMNDKNAHAPQNQYQQSKYKNNQNIKTIAEKTSEISENIKFQRTERKIISQNEFEFNDDKKDEEMIIKILKGMKNRGGNIEKRITYIKQFMFNAMYDICYKNNNEHEQKINNNNNKNESKEPRLSQLINIEKKQMCKFGHTHFRYADAYGKHVMLDNKCVQCQSMIDRKYCLDCSSYNKNDGWASFNGTGIDSSDVKGK
eukprot:276824_1